MSLRNILSTYNLLAVSANLRETAINTEQTLDTSMLVSKENIINLERKRESNKDEMIGKEEGDSIYDLGAVSGATFDFGKAQPQHFGFVLAYALGSCSSAAAGAGHKHTITPIVADLDAARSNPSFTAAMRFAKQIMKVRYASMFVDSFTASFPKDDWVKLSATIKGTGKITNSIYEETLAALDNVTELTLLANDVEGADAPTRLSNMQRIIVNYPSGVWTDVVYSVVSAAKPAKITIVSPGGSGGTVNYKLLYIPKEAGWMVLPERVNETPLRVSQLFVNIGGKWNGTIIAGGHTMGAEIKSFEWKFNNNITPETTPGSGLTGYASRAKRTGREQTLSLGREFQDYVFQQHIDLNDDFVVYAIAEGAEFDTGHKYTVQVVFPQVRVLTAPIGVDNNRLSEALELQILEDGTYGSVVAYVKNLQPKYADVA